jgi:hypothetical protein
MISPWWEPRAIPLFNMTASFHHDRSLGPYNFFNITASFHHDWCLRPYNLFKITA